MLFELAPEVDLRVLETQLPSASEESGVRHAFGPSSRPLATKDGKGEGDGSTNARGGALVLHRGAASATASSSTGGVQITAVTTSGALGAGGVPMMKGKQTATAVSMDKHAFADLHAAERDGGRRMFGNAKTDDATGRTAGSKSYRDADDDVPEITIVTEKREGTEDIGAPAAADRPAKKQKTNARARSPAIEPEGLIQEKYRCDYQGRSFLRCPLQPNDKAAVIPTKVIHAYKGHGKSGIQVLEWMPPLGHLLFSADLSGTVRLWDVMDHRQEVGRFTSHGKSITSLTVDPSGRKFSTASYDGRIRVWDTERAEVVTTLDCEEDTYCRTHKFHPQENQSNMLLSGVDRKVLLWDLRSGKVAREYDRHTSSVMSLTFFDRTGNKFISTAEDKTVRTWDYNVPVQIQVFADAAMHAVTHVVRHPTDDAFILQSLDNKGIIMNLARRNNSIRFNKSRHFSGHVISGTACTLAVSRDGKYVSSGDVNGSLHIWEYGNAKEVKTFRAHGKQLVQHLWHPTEPSLVATSGWDGTIKLWSA